MRDPRLQIFIDNFRKNETRSITVREYMRGIRLNTEHIHKGDTETVEIEFLTEKGLSRKMIEYNVKNNKVSVK